MTILVSGSKVRNFYSMQQRWCVLTSSIAKSWINFNLKPQTYMTASIRSGPWAKIVRSKVFWIFSMTRVNNQVPDPSSTGYRFLEYRLYGVSVLEIPAQKYAWARMIAYRCQFLRCGASKFIASISICIYIFLKYTYTGVCLLASTALHPRVSVPLFPHQFS
jgi:hypothetical protein